MTAEWRPVLDTDGFYEVSNEGTVRRVKPLERGKAGPIKAYLLNIGRYILKLKIPGKPMMDVLLHRVVAAAFLGPCPQGKEVNHKDHDKRNNRADNLEYVTRSENMRHSYAHGRPKPWSKKRDQCKLTDQQVRDIRRRYAQGEGRSSLAREYGVANQTIYKITIGRSHRDVK